MNELHIQAGPALLAGNLSIPDGAPGLVLFAHGSGSSRHSPRNQFVARTLNNAGLATLLFDLLTPEEELIDARTAELRFDINLLAERLVHATKWAKQQKETRDSRIGFEASNQYYYVPLDLVEKVINCHDLLGHRPGHAD